MTDLLAEQRQYIVFLKGLKCPSLPDRVPLAALLDLWVSLQPDEDDPDVVRAVGRRWSGQYTEAARGQYLDDIVRFATSIRSAITAALDRGEADSRVIRTADFGEVVPWAPAGSGIPLAAAILSSLPKDHRLRESFPGPFLLNGRGVVLLGIMATLKEPRPWYLVRDAAALTTSHAIRQRRDEEERRRQEQLRLAAEQAAREADPQWQIARLKARVAELEAQTGGSSK